MGKQYSNLSYEEWVKIEHWHRSGRSIRFIARELGRSPNTISYELRNLQVSDEYAAKKASVKAYQKRWMARSTTNRVARDVTLRSYVDESLDKGWSPEELAGSSPIPVSKRTIYHWYDQFRAHLPEEYHVLEHIMQLDEAYFKKLVFGYGKADRLT